MERKMLPTIYIQSRTFVDTRRYGSWNLFVSPSPMGAKLRTFLRRILNRAKLNVKVLANKFDLNGLDLGFVLRDLVATTSLYKI